MVWLREVLAVPFGYIMGLLYMFTGDYLVSIVILTVAVKLAMLPVSIKQQKNTSRQVRLQPKIKKIRERYKGDQRRIGEETQALYNREGFSVTQGGCMPLLVQFPVMIGLFGVIYTPLSNVLRITNGTMTALIAAFREYAEVAGIKLQDHTIEITLLEHFGEFIKSSSESAVAAFKMLSEANLTAINRFIDGFQLFGIPLFEVPDAKSFSKLWLFPILAGVTSLMSAGFMYVKQKQQNPEMANNPSMGCMTFSSPLMSVAFAFMFPAGVGFYWIISNIIAFIQTVTLSLLYSPKKVIARNMVEETVVRRARENNVKKRIENEN